VVEAGVMAMLPGRQQPGPDRCRSQWGIQAVLSPGGISKRLTRLLAPPAPLSALGLPSPPARPRS